MKKFLLSIIALCAFSLMASAQFQVTVKLTGTCVFPDQDTYYAVWVGVENTVTHQIVETQVSVTPTTNYSYPPIIQIQLDAFCTADNTKLYKIQVEAAKIYQTTPPTVICSNKITTTETFSCEDFLNNIDLTLSNPITLQ